MKEFRCGGEPAKRSNRPPHVAQCERLIPKAKFGAFTGEDYRKGSLERLEDALILLRAEQYAGCASEAGRALEGMLRAVIWTRDADVRSGKKTLETGHDLRELLTHVRNPGLLSASRPLNDELEERVQRIGRLWFNNMGFASSKYVETRWYFLGEIRKGRTFKRATELFYYNCMAILKRCEVLCQR